MDKAGFFSTDATDFKDHGGNKSAFINARTLELYGQLTGKKSSPSVAKTSPAPKGSPPGTGTQADPFKATTQEHIDWFTANAASGAVIEVNGQLFNK